MLLLNNEFDKEIVIESFVCDNNFFIFVMSNKRAL